MATQAMRMPAWPAGVPLPVQNCDGTWRTPIYRPEYHRWELSNWEPDNIGSCKRYIGSREWCGDPECEALHEEDFDAKKLAWLRRYRPELTPRGPRRVARRAA